MKKIVVMIIALVGLQVYGLETVCPVGYHEQNEDLDMHICVKDNTTGTLENGKTCYETPSGKLCPNKGLLGGADDAVANDNDDLSSCQENCKNVCRIAGVVDQSSCETSCNEDCLKKQ